MKADEELNKGMDRGPLHGIPYGLKDLFAVKGTKTTWGAAPYKNQIIDEDAYVLNAHFKDRSLFSLGEEFSLLRRANMFLINSLTEEELNRAGHSNHQNITVRALVFILAGHVKHHSNIIKERYL